MATPEIQAMRIAARSAGGGSNSQSTGEAEPKAGADPSPPAPASASAQMYERILRRRRANRPPIAGSSRSEVGSRIVAIFATSFAMPISRAVERAIPNTAPPQIIASRPIGDPAVEVGVGHARPGKWTSVRSCSRPAQSRQSTMSQHGISAHIVRSTCDWRSRKVARHCALAIPRSKSGTRTCTRRDSCSLESERVMSRR